MSGLTVLLFGVCALLLLMACVSADRVRALRESWNPSAPDLPDAAFTVARVVLVAAALGGVVVGFQGLAVEDRMEWSDDELTNAVEGATRALDGSSAYGDPVVVDESADFDAYASTIEQEVGEHGGGDAPQFGVNAELVGPPESGRAHYEVSARGAGAAFCMAVVRTQVGHVETAAPGLRGDAAAVKLPEYRFEVSSRAGYC
ncbi:hypothetical protein [Streptomyces sudanensis]|uniref:hypothetical protein n=1 Tax=Streptomyces sudanensis TaxID=436397 RepID=UPI0020CEFC0A|nr:hypothetical protein [Streptomyces sudanensis]MCP9958950.1 hypothetical protein [Streptomyces sudanensis]